MSRARNRNDSLSCSDSYDREVFSGPEFKHPEIICPQMTVNRKPLSHPTMTLKQCIDRIKVGNPCTISCKILDEIRSLK